MASLFTPVRCSAATTITSQFHFSVSRSRPIALTFTTNPPPWNRTPSRRSTHSMSQQPDSASATQPCSTNSQNDAAKAEGTTDVIVQYVVLRRDLIDSWPLGSVVTQGCHASVSAIWSHKDDPHTLQYCSLENLDSMHKVTLEVKGEPQILNLSEKLRAGGIAHKLWIEQPENFPTCLATKPYPKSMVSLHFKKLKLCK